MKPLSPIDIEHIILLAWADTVPFEAIEREYGLDEAAVQTLMRTHQSPKTYVRWRKRLRARTGSKSKHERLTKKTSDRQKYF